MNDQEPFSYDSFSKLTGVALSNYVGAYLGSSLVVPQAALERMRADLEHYDELHLILALQLGAIRGSRGFAEVTPRYLVHKSQSVRLAATRALDWLPDDCISSELVSDVRIHLRDCPESKQSDHVAESADRLERRKAKGVAV